jgi:hypothetical protein
MRPVFAICFAVFVFASRLPAGAQSAASNEAHAKILNGQNVLFDLKTPENARIIEAAWIQEAAANHKAIDIYGGVIKDAARLENLTFDTEVLFRQCLFERFVDFGHSVFKGGFVSQQAEFRGGASFDNVTFNSRAIFDSTIFKNGGGWFQDIRSTGTFSARQVTFGGRDTTVTNFVRAHFELDTAFDFSTFDTTADFSASEFDQKVDFFGAQFHREAAFERSHFAGPTSFGNQDDKFAPTFTKKASFTLAQFDSDVWFVGARFRSDANFISVRFGRDAFFQHASFDGDARFDRSQVVGSMFFRSSTVLGATVPSATFARSAHFDYVRFESDAFFNGAKFNGAVSFQGSTSRAVHFSELRDAVPEEEEKAEFGSTVDLRGFTYDRIQAPWRDLLGRRKVYDRQPYTQLEKVFRAVGEDEEADDVYLQRRKVERQEVKWKENKFSWVRDSLWWLTANYGIFSGNILSWNMIVIPVAFVMLGTFLFRCPGAVRRNVAGDGSRSIDRIGIEGSFRLAVRIFLPLDLPGQSSWMPSRRKVCRKLNCRLRYSDYAAWLKILGWVFVPLWVGVIAGTFRYVKS